MATYEIKGIEESGVYVVVTKADGTTFGQLLQNMDLSSESAALLSIKNQIEMFASESTKAISLSDLAKYVGSSVQIAEPAPVTTSSIQGG